MSVNPRRRQRLTILALFALFMLPVLLALLLNLPGVRWAPFGLRNNGELLQPPPSLAALELRAIDGGDLGATPLEDTWSLLVAAATPCDAICESAIDKAQRARLALGEHGGRLRLLWLPSGDATLDAQRVDELRARFPALRVAHVEAPPDWLLGADAGLRLHVVDPRAFAILRYSRDFEGRGLLKDLERLLRYAKDDR